MVHPTSPFKNLKDLENDANKDPSNFTWTSVGGAGGQDYVIRKFLKVIGVNVFKTKPIMCHGAAQAIVLTAGGNSKMGVASLGSSLPAIRGGTIRPLAITSKYRLPDLPDLPTTAELGYPTIDIHDYYGPSGPPKLPPYIVDKWNKAMEEMLKDPEATSRIEKMGSKPTYFNSLEYREFIIKATEEVKELWKLK
jgi:tripartite-type tricarboxylate transporter receptor subunit TctC